MKYRGNKGRRQKKHQVDDPGLTNIHVKNQRQPKHKKAAATGAKSRKKAQHDAHGDGKRDTF